MSRVTIYDCPLCGAQVEGQEAYTLHLLKENPGGVTTGQFLRWGAGSRAVGARIFDLREKGHEIDTRPISGSSTFLYVWTGFNPDAEGGDAPAGSSSPASVRRIAPLGADMADVCWATRECRSAGPLDGPTCPRGDWHTVRRVHYADPQWAAREQIARAAA